ncbi:MAG: apolipoprotein N-acyltransferase [Candidatus Omnitrophica bacterium]|nr:apolipoprotein N-acyltransferase [Candidatus Omnitrophota bacterium]
MLSALSSAILLILSFPKFSLWPLAWVAFVPIFYQLDRLEQKREAFLYSYLFGFFFFLVTWEWLRHVTYFGWIVLVVLYAFYFGMFGIVSHWFLKRRHFFLSLFVLPSAWTALEWIRTEIPDWGFGFNSLSYSQASVLPVAGMAAFVGAYGVSWLIMFVNVTFFLLIHFFRTHRKVDLLDLTFAFVFLALVFGSHLNYQTSLKESRDAESVRIAVIQGNIPQEEKWDQNLKSKILEIHEKLSRLVTYDEKPNLIIWPEAAFPGFLNLDPLQERVFKLERELKIPLLIGAPYLGRSSEGKAIAYNSAYLLAKRDSMEHRYDKVRLVAFGEYVPWRWFFGPLGLERFAYSLGVSDFYPGKDVHVFTMDRQHQFSALICFEDTFPFLARRSVEKGAEFLVVMTNDAWFGKSAAPYQHLDASIFRAIENGIPLVRAANTGVSAFISSQGEVLDRVKDQAGHDTFIAGVLTRSIKFGRQKTVYQSYGYQFPLCSLALTLVGFGFALVSRRIR